MNVRFQKAIALAAEQAPIVPYSELDGLKRASRQPVGKAAAIDHKGRLTAVANNAAREAIAAYKLENPEAGDFGVFGTLSAFKRRAKGFADMPATAVNLMACQPALRRLSNEKICQHLASESGLKIPANYFTELLTAAAKKKVIIALEGLSLPPEWAELGSLSKIKRAMNANQLARNASSQFCGTVSFSSAAVVVGDRKFPVKDGRIRVGDARLNLAGLMALLGVS